MNIPERNGPCSCGSGKKYKKCCGQPKLKTFHATKFGNNLHSNFLKHQFTQVSSLLKQQYEKQKEKAQQSTGQVPSQDEKNS